MPRTSAYRIRIRTGSADKQGLLLLADGELVAVLVKLADEGHGDARGRWAIETCFGLDSGPRPETFASADDAARWISEHDGGHPFVLDANLVELS